MAPTTPKMKEKNYTLSELNRMLDLVEQMLSFGSDQWESLLPATTLTYQAVNRSAVAMHSDVDLDENSDQDGGWDSDGVDVPDGVIAAVEAAAEETNLRNCAPRAPSTSRK
ncbi:hypothetical protein ON010_g11487 [Phytophthora cinnamomi]|nr:hypothetical protein ON010_g11487 [Phytophthora cinnamomi]